MTGRGQGGYVLSPTRVRRLRVTDEGVDVHDGEREQRVPPSLAHATPRTWRAAWPSAASAAPSRTPISRSSSTGASCRTRCRPTAPSLALPRLSTTTTVEVVPRADADGPGVAPGFGDARVRAFLDAMLGPLLPPGHVLRVETRNDFPSACGIASSASGFAALVRAVASLAEIDDDDWCAQWARLGSGSAIRSVPDASPLVSWEGATAHAYDVHPSLALEHCLVVFDPFPKAVSSSDGHAHAPSCPFHAMRVAAADGHVDDVVRAFARGDFDTIRRVTEAEALTMHLVMYGSEPRIRYMDDASVAFVARFVDFRNAHALPAMYTVDAGSNVHLLWKPPARDAVLGFARAAKHMFTLYKGVPEYRYRVVLLSGKRFSGKTHLANALVRHVDGGDAPRLQVRHLSTAIKDGYWAQAGEGEGDRESREVKERHRARMIAHGDAARARDPYHWCRRLWEGLAPAPSTVLVTDARRASDVAFFRRCACATLVRLEADDATRRARGWAHDPAVDEHESETGLDEGTAYDFVVEGADYDVGKLSADLFGV